MKDKLEKIKTFLDEVRAARSKISDKDLDDIRTWIKYNKEMESCEGASFNVRSYLADDVSLDSLHSVEEDLNEILETWDDLYEEE